MRFWLRHWWKHLRLCRRNGLAAANCRFRRDKRRRPEYYRNLARNLPATRTFKKSS